MRAYALLTALALVLTAGGALLLSRGGTDVPDRVLIRTLSDPKWGDVEVYRLQSPDLPHRDVLSIERVFLDGSDLTLARRSLGRVVPSSVQFVRDGVNLGVACDWLLDGVREGQVWRDTTWARVGSYP